MTKNNFIHMNKKDDESVFRGLKRFNLFMGFLHLVQSIAIYAISNDFSLPVRSYYLRLLEGRQRERGIRTKMRVKLSSKLLVIAWTMMKKGEEFNPSLLT